MKIGVMLRHLGELGGIGVYTTNVLNTLFQIDRRNRYVLLYNRTEQLGQFPPFSNVTEHVLNAPNKIYWDQISVPRFANKEGLDLIYNPKLSIPLFTQCKTVLVMHGAEQFAIPHVFKWHDRVYFSIANRLYCKKSSAIISMTHLGAKDITRYMGANAEKIHVIHEAYNARCQVLDVEGLQGVKNKYSLPDRFILFVGGLSPLKNFGNLLRAYQRCQQSVRHKLVVVGFKRWKFSKDLQLIDRLGLREYVQFVGFVPDDEIPAFYNMADIFVFPSLYEGFGIPVLEAMACGCPVITSETGCSPEVAGDAALLVDPYSPDRIAVAIIKLLSDDMLRKELIEKGLKRASQFSWKKCAEETHALFESLNGGNA